MASSETTRSVSYFRQLLEELGFPHKPVSPTYASPLTTKPRRTSSSGLYSAHHKKSKHVERRYLFIQEMIENNKFFCPYAKTAEDNTADFCSALLSPRNNS